MIESTKIVRLFSVTLLAGSAAAATATTVNDPMPILRNPKHERVA